MELLCPAGNLPALKAAVDNGADAVYIGLKDDTNARHFAGLNFTEKKLQEAVNYVHRHQRKLHIAINTFAHPDGFERWQKAIDMAAHLGADALILADIATLEYAAERYPQIELMYRYRRRPLILRQSHFINAILMLHVLYYHAFFLFIKSNNWLKVVLFL